MYATAHLPGDEHVELVDLGPSDSASSAAFSKSQRLAAQRAPYPDTLYGGFHPITTAEIAEITAWNAQTAASQLTKKNLTPLLERGYEYEKVQRWSKMDDSTFYGKNPTISKVQRTTGDDPSHSADEDGDKDDEDDEGHSIENQDGPSGSSQSEQPFTIIDTPLGSSESATSTIRQFTPNSMHSALSAMSLDGPSPWLTDDIHVGVTQESEKFPPLGPAPPQTHPHTARPKKYTSDTWISASEWVARLEQEDENARPITPPPPPQFQNLTIQLGRRAGRISPRMAKVLKARFEGVLATASAQHFKRDFQLALYFNQGAD
jgi:hypothetical protein